MAQADVSSPRRAWWKPLTRAQSNPMPPGILNSIRTRQNIDNGRLVKRLFWVGASGFFARSYTFFSGNVIKLELLYAYPPAGRLNDNPGMVLDQIGHVAALVSMIGVGILADLYGRKRLYGYELLLLVVATLGIAQASEGFRSLLPDGTVRGTMDIYAWLAFWRFCLGIAIGAEQPLVAIITAEWVRTKSRGRMMAAIFAVQPLARLVAYGVALVALQRVSKANGLPPDAVGGGGLDEELQKRVADHVWRWATGMGIIPALVAIGFRLTIPETPLYYAHILLDAAKGAKTAEWLYGVASTRSPLGASPTMPPAEGRDDADIDSPVSEPLKFRRREWYAGAVRCLLTKPAGRNLLVISSLWMLSDISWYLLAMDSLAPASTLRPDDEKPDTPNQPSLYRELEGSAKRFMLVVSIGSLLGSAVLLAVINRVHRRVLLMATCGALAALFAITGAVLLGMDEEAVRVGTASNTAVDVLSGMMHFLFTLGPRAILPILASELFPTVYRGTFYSLACAAGRLGAIIVRPVIGETSTMDHAMGSRLMVAFVLMGACVVISYFVPEVQRAPRTVGEDDDTETGSEMEGSGSAGANVSEKGTGIGAARRRAKGWVALVFPKRETMTLEEIAPNPHEREMSVRDRPALP